MTSEELRNKTIGVLMGGVSPEREISLKTGKAILRALTEKRYRACAIDVDSSVAESLKQGMIQVAFVALHGRLGEDGSVQGMLEVMGIPYTGSGVLASALAMNKVASKKLFSYHHLPTPYFQKKGRLQHQPRDSCHWRMSASRTPPGASSRSGNQPARVRYPGGHLPLGGQSPQRPAWEDDFDDEGDFDAEDELPVFDRRMMEGSLAELVGAMEDGPSFEDPKLRKAQKLMYRAWEEDNPAKRLNLAHKALSLSSNCADAYVLLAEEEADTVARAPELYRQGVAAGERALGPQ